MVVEEREIEDMRQKRRDKVEGKQKVIFTNVIDGETLRSLGMVACKQQTTLKDLRDKISSKYGKLCPKFEFKNLPIDDERTFQVESEILVTDGFVPKCVVNILHSN